MSDIRHAKICVPIHLRMEPVASTPVRVAKVRPPFWYQMMASAASIASIIAVLVIYLAIQY